MRYLIQYSELYEDAKWVHDNLYAYNLSKTGNDRQEIILENNPDRKTFLAVQSDGKRLGGCSWHVRKEDQILFVDFLWLSDASRGSGCGSMLLETVESKAEELQCHGVELTTNTFQAPGFYRKMGYKVIHEEKAPQKNLPDNIHYIFRKNF